jgi:uncharacterized membrane protein
VTDTASRTPPTATTRLLISLLIGALITALVWTTVEPRAGLLAGMTGFAATFVVLGWSVLWPLSADDTRAWAGREDFHPATEEVVVISFALAGLIGLIALMTVGHSEYKQLEAGLGLLGVLAVWAGIHLTYATRYAHVFYVSAPGSIQFNEDDYLPCFRDFFYFSYNLGMTYQVSDTAVGSGSVRAVVLRHCLLSYLFGAVILAATFNLVTGLFTG